MKHLIKKFLENPEEGTPPIVTEAMKRLDEKLSNPPVPLMSQEEFEKLPYSHKCVLTCNMPGCGDVVSTHHGLCLKHTLEYEAKNHQA